MKKRNSGVVILKLRVERTYSRIRNPAWTSFPVSHYMMSGAALLQYRSNPGNPSYSLLIVDNAGYTEIIQISDLPALRDLYQVGIDDRDHDLSHVCKVVVTINWYQVWFKPSIRSASQIIFGGFLAGRAHTTAVLGILCTPTIKNGNYENGEPFLPLAEVCALHRADQVQQAVDRFALFTMGQGYPD